jgi:hypothetical protein
MYCGPFSGVKLPGREADYSPPSTVEGKNTLASSTKHKINKLRLFYWASELYGLTTAEAGETSEDFC